MKKSTKDTELEKLQKRVEKLVKANKSLKKDKRNLKRRLTTSQNKSNIITAKPKAHAFKNEMCFPLTKTKCEFKKAPKQQV